MQKERKSVFKETSKILSNNFSKKNKASRQKSRESGRIGKIVVQSLKISSS